MQSQVQGPTCLPTRYAMSVPLWFSFLNTWPTADALVPSGKIIRLCYVTLKITGIIQKLKLLGRALEAVVSRQSPYGRYLRPDEVSGSSGGGAMCPICHDEPSTPVRLGCSHVFCEDCIAEWLQRERTCPICRSLVRTAPQVSSDGSTSVLPVIF